MNRKLLDKRFWIAIPVGVAALSLLFFFVMEPQEAEVRRTKAEVQAEQARYVRLSVLSTVIDELREKKVAISQTMDRFLRAREKEEVSLVVPATLINILKESKVTLMSIRPVPEKVEGDLLISSWNMQVLTTYHELGYFISRLEKSDEFNRIDSLTISSGEGPLERNVNLVASRISLLKREQEEQ
ncbi:hypothetical protein KAS10_03455 [Candidatus Aerophobetes bacterium]|nr:hypothetical protein [Candidatus Aerophobetes bacterium]